MTKPTNSSATTITTLIAQRQAELNLFGFRLALANHRTIVTGAFSRLVLEEYPEGDKNSP